MTSQRDLKPTEDSTVEQVLDFVREGIISGRYPPQSKLLPKQIAEHCGTSFIPVREALRVLESEGFVSFVHNRGAWVTPLSLGDLKDLYEIRLELECEAVRRAEPFSPAELDELERLLDRSQRYDARRQRARVVQLNEDFHYAIYRKCNSPRRMKLIEQLWSHSARYQHLSLDYRHDAADTEHRAVVAALRRGDHDAAADELKTHLSTTVSLLRQGCRELAGATEGDESELVAS